jgi:hypothetical protein
MKHEGGGEGAWMGVCNIDIDRRHSIAIACRIVSRSNPADMKSKAGYKASGSLAIAFFL